MGGFSPNFPGLWLRVSTRKIIFLFLNQNICCGYSKELSQWDGYFEHLKHMLKIMGRLNIFTILRWNFCLSKPMLSKKRFLVGRQRWLDFCDSSNPQPLNLDSSTLTLSPGAPLWICKLSPMKWNNSPDSKFCLLNSLSARIELP